jgi:hypothetical protein
MDLLTDGLQANGEWKLSETHIGSDKIHFSIYPAVIYQPHLHMMVPRIRKATASSTFTSTLSMTSHGKEWWRLMLGLVRTCTSTGEYDEQVTKLWWVTWVKGQIN